MKPFAVPVLLLLSLAGAAVAQSTPSTQSVLDRALDAMFPVAQSTPSTQSVTRSSVEEHNRVASESVPSQPEMGVSLSSLSLLVSQRDQYRARVASLRKEITGLEAKLAVDPREVLRNIIESITRVEVELLRLKTSASGDTQLTKNLVPFAATLSSQHETKQRQLSVLEVSAPVEIEKTVRQLLTRRDDLRDAEVLLSSLEDQVTTARTDRELARGFEDLKVMNKEPSLPAKDTPAGGPIKK